MEKAMAPHSSALVWKIPWTEEPGRLQSMGSGRVGHDWATSLSVFTFIPWRRKWRPTLVFLTGESQGWEPGGLPSMGSHRTGHDWRDLAAAASKNSLTAPAVVSDRIFAMPYFLGACDKSSPLPIYPMLQSALYHCHRLMKQTTENPTPFWARELESPYRDAFSLGRLLRSQAPHSVEQALVSSRSPELTQICSFFWLSPEKSPLYISTMSSLSIHLWMDI